MAVTEGTPGGKYFLSPHFRQIKTESKIEKVPKMESGSIHFRKEIDRFTSGQDLSGSNRRGVLTLPCRLKSVCGFSWQRLVIKGGYHATSKLLWDRWHVLW